MRVRDDSNEKRPPFQHAPPGLHEAICCDWVDLGEVEWTYEGKTRVKPGVRLCYLLEQRQEDGRPYYISKKFPVTFRGPKAGLRKWIGQWRGKLMSDAEAEEGVELEDLYAKQCRLLVVEVANGDDPYSVIDAIMPPKKGGPDLRGLLHEEGCYVRVKDREKEREKPRKGPTAKRQDPEAWDQDMDDIRTQGGASDGLPF